MNDAMLWVAIGSGGAAGAILRGLIFRVVERWADEEADGGLAEFGAARATLLVNILGSFVLGWVVGSLGLPSGGATDPLVAFWVTGLCGAVTTFSTLCADAMSLARSHGRRHLATVILSNALLGIAALAIGLTISA